MARPDLHFTRDDYDRIPEDLRVELICGELLKMASPVVEHQRIVGRIHLDLSRILGEERVLLGPLDFGIDDANVLVPDVVAVETAPPIDAKDISTAQLVFEVLSPSTAARDRTVKSDLYLEAGVLEVWLVDPRSKTIEIRTRGGLRTVRGDEAALSAAVPGIRFEAARLFRA